MLGYDRLVDPPKSIECALVAVDPKGDLIRVHEIFDSRFFAEKLRIRRAPKVVPISFARCILKDLIEYVFSRPENDDTLDDDKIIFVLPCEHVSNGPCVSLHCGEIMHPSLELGRWKGEKRYLRVSDSVALRSCAQALAAVFLHESAQSGLLNRSYFIVDVIGYRFVDINVDDLVTAVGETDRNGRSDVTTLDDTDVHLPAIIQLSALRVLKINDYSPLRDCGLAEKFKVLRYCTSLVTRS